MPVLPRQRHRARRLAFALLLLVLSTTPALTIAQQSSPEVAAGQLTAVLPEWHDELLPVMQSVSARYALDAEVALPDEATPSPGITGRMAIEYTNTTGSSLTELPFRLYANRPEDDSEALQVGDVTVAGANATTTFSDDGSTVFVSFAEPLPADASVSIAMSFVTTVPTDERHHYGIFNLDTDSGTWALAHWYPILAGWDPERGWVLDPPSENGDPIFSTTSTYDVTLRTPESWRAVTTGVEIDRTTTGSATERRFVSGPARDFTMVLDDDFEVVERQVEGTTISSWYNPGEQRTGQAVLDYAEQSLSYFNELVGPYPYTTLDIVPADLFGAAGVEFPQLFYMGASYYGPDTSLEVPNGLDFTVAHEVLHSWWYDMVGNNQYDHAFIDEGLTNFMSSTMYFTAEYGPEIGEVTTERYLQGPFESTVNADDDQVVDSPTDDFSSGSDYTFAAYQKAPLGFKAIHDEIGAEAFDEAVTDYFYDNWFTVASPDDLQAAFEEASGQDLDELWSHWFEEAAGEDDV